ncbi:MAG: acyl-ACP--UDP-N-acetylglucosamine O-acyltransferase [Candidatus Omnitrophica bacterium]|nr:acyl-ACP--UDP-N-acetylglucosamine O-acyltransferase [Candidatus Omnitrophota bacterium]
MSSIHPTALIGKDAEIGVDNSIGPNVIIEDGVKIGAHNKILSGVYIAAGTEIGNYNEIHMNAVIGHTPQDVAFKGGKTFTLIGNHNIIREFATIHRGTKEGTFTVIGDYNFIMAYCHIAHNCVLGNKIIMVNQASLTGYCIVEDGAFLSGITGFHQFSRIGRLAMVSALSASNKDIPPFMTCGGRPAVAVGVNMVGMKRAGISAAERTEVKEAYRLLYRCGLNVSQALEKIQGTLHSESVKHLVSFIKASKRGILDGAGSSEETLKSRKAAETSLASEDDSEI